MKTNVNRVARNRLSTYIADSQNKFCHMCGNLTPITQLYAEIYMNNLYGYTCLDCHKI
jgi:hypothetical protein